MEKDKTQSVGQHGTGLEGTFKSRPPLSSPTIDKDQLALVIAYRVDGHSLVELMRRAA